MSIAYRLLDRLVQESWAHRKQGGGSVHIVVCALVLLASGQVLSDPLAVRTDPHDLFQRSAAAIARRDLDAAVPLLEALTHEHKDSPLAEVAAFHLGECYLLLSRSEPAMSLLRDWSERIESSPTVEQIEPGIKSRTRQLLTRLLEGLPDEPRTLEQLERLIASPLETVPNHPSDGRPSRWSMAIALELSQRYERSKDFAAAVHWLRRVVEAEAQEANLSTNQHEQKLHCDLPLAWAEHAISNNQPKVAVEVLQSTLSQSQGLDRELALRFLLAEAHFAAGQPTKAHEQFQWLVDHAEQSESAPPWLASVTLRRAELLVRSKATAEAIELLQQAKKRHVDFELAYEFDYLLAQCAVARIEFDEAIQLLQQVINAPTASGREAIARATWLMGEVHFLQRHYPQAIAAYAQVSQFDAFPRWQARALLQSAKCHELLGDVRSAVAAYKRAAVLSQQPEIAQIAAERIAVIESALPNLK